MKRIALPLSIAIISAHWIYSFSTALFRTGEPFRPTGVSWLALYVCVKTVIVVAVIGPLLLANGERFASLGFSIGDLRAAPWCEESSSRSPFLS